MEQEMLAQQAAEKDHRIQVSYLIIINLYNELDMILLKICISFWTCIHFYIYEIYWGFIDDLSFVLFDW